MDGFCPFFRIVIPYKLPHCSGAGIGIGESVVVIPGPGTFQGSRLYAAAGPFESLDILQAQNIVGEIQKLRQKSRMVQGTHCFPARCGKRVPLF